MEECMQPKSQTLEEIRQAISAIPDHPMATGFLVNDIYRQLRKMETQFEGIHKKIGFLKSSIRKLQETKTDNSQKEQVTIEVIEDEV